LNVVGWLDEDDRESQRSGLPVSSLDSIAALEFDLILIAAIDCEYSEALAKRLESRGVDRAKISILRPNFQQLDERLRALGFDLDSFHFSPRAEMTSRRLHKAAGNS